jgi:hypothetical protein
MITIHGIPATPWQLRSLEQGQLKAIVLPLLPQIETDEMGWKFWRSNVYETTLAFAPSEKPFAYPGSYAQLRYQKGDRIYLQERWRKGDWGAAFDDDIYFTESTTLEAENIGWQPPETMPQAAAQHWLEITSVRVVQVIDLTLEDYASTGLNDANSAKNSSDSIWDCVALAAKRWEAAYPQQAWGEGDRWVVLLEVSACSAPD